MKKRYVLSVLTMLINMSVGAGTVTTNLLYFGNDWDGAPAGSFRVLTQIINNSNFVSNADDTWYRSSVEGAIAVSDSSTANNRTPPPGVTGGVALRIGYASSGTTLAAQLALSESDWDNTVDTYRLTTVSRIAARDGSVAVPATGSIRVQLGYVLITTNNPNGVLGYNISEDVVIGTSGWTTNVQEIAGADLVGGNGKPIVLRVLNRLGNDADHFTWVDSMKLEKLTVDPYLDWAAKYDLFDEDAALTNNYDGDALSNLGEYALGGNPTNANDTGLAKCGVVTIGGTNYFEYIYPRRSDWERAGLLYTIHETDSLTLGDFSEGWFQVGVGLAEENNGFDAEYDAVTNYVPTATNDTRFIRLDIKME